VTGVFLSAPTRETLEAGKETWRNIMHLPATAVSVLCILLAMGLGATLLGRRFRYYSYTPWMGITERISIYAIMLWVAVLAIGLLRAQKSE
jgi:hypothetical protein